MRTLFKQIGAVYSVSKLFTYVMEGLKSKNARQRTGKCNFILITLLLYTHPCTA